MLFIDASELSANISRTHKELTDGHVAKIAQTYRAWRDRDGYEDETGYSMAVPVEMVRESDYKIYPASYVLGDGLAGREERDLFAAVASSAAESAQAALLDISTLRPEFEVKITQIRNDAVSLSQSLEYETVTLGDFLERSTEKLGDAEEPEVLTCTESGGLILQRERFAKRVATEDATKYKVVRRGDIVYNPYLLWKGSIDQCWIVETGITSPAYEIFRVRDGWHRTLLGEIVISDEMIRRYDGISFGTVQRRRRAAPENFLAMKVRVPIGPVAQELASLLEVARACQLAGRTTERSFKELVSELATGVPS